MSLNRRLLSIYLNDHLAGSTVGRELSRRTLGSNRGTEFEPFLEKLAREIDEDRDTLIEIMDALGVKKDPVKRLAPMVAERAGRLKLNGSLLSYSPLSRLVEFEGLSLGVEGKLSLWRALGDIDRPELQRFDLAALAERAAAQREGLEARRLEAARLAFAP